MSITEEQIEEWLRERAVAPCDYSRKLARDVLERDALARADKKQVEVQP